NVPYKDITRKNFQPRNHFTASQPKISIENPLVRVPVNATCEVEEAYDAIITKEVEESEEAEDSQITYVVYESEEEYYEEVVSEMNSESYVVMTREQLNKKKDIFQLDKKERAKEVSTIIPVVAKIGSPILYVAKK
ncbi:hypothetical protein KI387_044518, partial [Taxus chinensis]